MNICLFSSEEILKPLSMHDKRAEHLVKILHKQVGDCFEAGIVGGMAGTALITSISDKNSPDKGTIHFTFTPATEGKKLYPLTMIIGFPRPIQLRRLLRDIAGLGVCEVHLTGTELGEKSYLHSSLAEHDNAEALLREGTAQAASTHVPRLILHDRLSDCLASVQQPVRIALDNVAPNGSLPQFLAQNLKKDPPQQIIAAVGSERGWTDKERQLLEQHKFVRCGMGPRILRTETAATAAAAIILASMGALEQY